MTMNDARFAVVEGDEVFGSDGDKVGNIVAIQNNYVVVEKGWFFPTDYYIPMSAIASYEEGKAYLNVTKDLALNQGWDTQPTVTDDTMATAATGIDTGRMTDTGYTTDATLADDRELDAATTAGWETDPAIAADRDRETTRADGEVLEVPVYEEELTATKRAHEVGGARIEKDVVEEDRVLEVPVTEERLKVVRRAVDRPVDAAGDVASDAFEETIVDVPIEVEDVEVGKRTRVAEEIAVQKEKVQRTEQVRGKVRHEDVTITEATEGAVVDDRQANI